MGENIDDAVIHVHDSGKGPGLLLLCGDVAPCIVEARATLFAEEGYSVFPLNCVRYRRCGESGKNALAEK